MISWLRLAQISHLNFEECHSELCGVFGILRNGIFDKMRGGHLENSSSRYNNLRGGDYSGI